jgi:hypothetical protein
MRKFGALRDVHDVRDRMYRASPRAEPVPQQVDLREWGGPIKDQGEEGSCTGHAYSSAREWIARKYEKTSPILSPQCLYVEELIADGCFSEDAGAMPRTGCQVLTAKGCCEASLYPYVAGKFTVPTAVQALNALKYKTGAYHRVGDLSDFLRCLADQTPWPVTVGFTVYESFMSQQVTDTGIMPIPKPGEQEQGGTKYSVSVTIKRNGSRLSRTVGATIGDNGVISGCHSRPSRGLTPICGWCTRADRGSNFVTLCSARRFPHDLRSCPFVHRGRISWRSLTSKC